MKELTLVRTQNVIKAEQLMLQLKNRPKTEMVGLGLLYGAPGLGKSRYAYLQSVRHNCCYFKLEAVDNTKSAAERLYFRLCRFIGQAGNIVRHTAPDIFGQIIEILQAHPELVIFVDEIDYAFNKRQLLGFLRDLVDSSLATVILVGMEDAKERLASLNSYYFDRCNYFCEFKPLSADDVALVLAQVAEVEFSPEAAAFLHQKSGGSLRLLVKSIYTAEIIAAQAGLKHIERSHLER